MLPKKTIFFIFLWSLGKNKAIVLNGFDILILKEQKSLSTTKKPLFGKRVRVVQLGWNHAAPTCHMKIIIH